jgi:hypothetical protein
MPVYIIELLSPIICCIISAAFVCVQYQDMTAMNTIERSALGRVARLGDLYDARSDQFQGTNIFKTRIPESCTRLTDNPSCNSIFVNEETFSEKFDKLGIAAELKLSFLSGMVAVEGSGKYLNEEKTRTKGIKATWMNDIRTVVERLELFYDELKDFVSFDALDTETATHFVVEVHWGGAACLTLESSDSDTMKARSRDASGGIGVSKSSIVNALRALTVNPSANASADNVDKLEEISKNFSFKLLGDILPEETDQMQMDLRSACAYVSQLSNRLKKANDGKGKPVKYILYPLPDRAFRRRLAPDAVFNSFYRQTEESIIAQFVSLFDNISYVKQQVSCLVSDVRNYRTCLTQYIATEILDLQTDLETGESTLRSRLADTLKEVRSGKQEPSELDRLHTEYLESEKSSRKIQTKLCDTKIVDARKKLDFAKTCADYDVNYFTGDHAVNRELIRNDYTYVMYASDSLKENDRDNWENHVMIFFDLVKNHEPTAVKPAFIFVDCNFDERLAKKEGTRIKRFRNNRCLCDDVGLFASQNVAQTAEKLSPATDTDLIEFTLPCPGSMLGLCDELCDDTPRQWLCRRHRHQLKYGIKDNHFHCPCGRAPVGAFTFRCEDKLKHGIENFIPFDEQILQHHLNELKLRSK